MMPSLEDPALAAGLTPPAAPALGTEVEQVMRALSRVGTDLLDSYQALARRAERMERELCRANAELERVLESLPTGVVVRDAAGRVLRTNRAVRSILGLAPGELEGCDQHPLLVAAAGEWTERQVTRADGRHLVLATVRTEIAAGGLEAERGAAGSVQIIDDRSELARLSQRLHALDKLVSLGNMAGGIAHELRNPMNAVKGFAALLAPGLEAGSKQREWAELIVEGVSEADAILSSMLTLAAPERIVLETVEGGLLLEQALSMAARDASAEFDSPGASERWSVVSAVEVPAFEGDRIKLRQALRNLISNAMQAQPGGGQVQVSIALEDAEVVLRVRDAGPGIPPELAGRVFDPFFTTRASGTGLGLALVGAIAQLHGGRADVSRAPAPLGGTEASIRIPFRPAA